MAKIMVSFPDDLLARVDEYAARVGKTRSALLQELAERELTDDTDARRAAIEHLLASPIHGGGDAADWIRQDRRTH